MEVRCLEEIIDYDGSQLRPHWIFDRLGLLGDVAVAFIGAARVIGESLVDRVDARAGDFIYSPRMLHFLIEHFNPELELAVSRQRLLVVCAAESLPRSAGVRRQGDDLYVGERKLSVSIATRSLTSSLIHLALNIETEGTPVPAMGLKELGLDPRSVAGEILAAYRQELLGIRDAVAKVRGVR